jgi:hypothetical protein
MRHVVQHEPQRVSQTYTLAHTHKGQPPGVVVVVVVGATVGGAAVVGCQRRGLRMRESSPTGSTICSVSVPLVSFVQSCVMELVLQSETNTGNAGNNTQNYSLA